VLEATQDELRLPRANHTTPLDAPAAVHPQVAAQDEAAVEAEQKVLPDRLHLLDSPTVQPLREPLYRRPRMRGLDLYGLADENLQPSGCPVERIASGHAEKPTIEP
jgi:hypothetical protein